MFFYDLSSMLDAWDQREAPSCSKNPNHHSSDTDPTRSGPGTVTEVVAWPALVLVLVGGALQALEPWALTHSDS